MRLPALDELDPDAVEDYGGKATTLARLRQEGYPVPDGFAVDARFSLDEDIASIEDELRERVEAMDAEAIVVRSSANLEDATASSFAGLFESFVVEPSDVLDAARRCHSFLEADRVDMYCRSVGIEKDELRLGLVVQEMIASDVCGVAFTEHPVRDREGTVVEAVRGAAYSEQDDITPDRWTFSPDLDLEDRSITAQPLVREVDDTDLREVDASVEEAVLTDEQARSIAEMARSIAADLGYEADVEWGMVDGDIVVFQARPITT